MTFNWRLAAGVVAGIVWAGGAGAASGGETVRLRIIVVDTAEKAEQIREAVRGGGEFAAFARRESQDPAAKEGGYLGVVRIASLRPELQEALEGLRPGEVSRVARVPTGYALLTVVPEADAPAEPGAGLSGNTPLSVEALVRQAPDTAGLIEVEGAFQRLPRDSGWNRDVASICRVHQTVVPKLSEAVTHALESIVPDTAAAGQYSYIRAVLEAYQGHMAQAISYWEDAYRASLKNRPDIAPVLEEVLGTAHLHKAEMDNDLYRHPGDRCLFPPPRGRARPLARTEDLDKAVGYFAKYLEGKPDDLEIKWLLNLAYFWLGRYPDTVPRAQLIPATAFECREPAAAWEDVAPEAGVDAFMVSSGLVVDDFDGDGLLDIVAGGYDTCEHLFFFHNNGDGTFSDRSAASGLARVPGGANVIQADYDNDGCADLLVLRGGWQIPMPLSLLRGHCDGTFTDVTAKAGLDGVLFATQTAAWADIDNDGWLDLFVGHEQGPSQLFRSRGDGTFENISAAAGIDRTAFTKTVAAGDYDGDGYPDFYVSNIRGGQNFLYHNNGNATFTEVAAQAHVEQTWRSFAAWFFDYDNDGRLDLFVASDYASVEETMRTYLGRTRTLGPMSLYRNLGDGTFRNVAEAVGLDKVYMPMGANFGDMDNDGYPDIYLGTGAPEFGAMAPNVLLRNREGKSFVDVAACTGTGELHKTHGIAFADLENDGDEDIVAAIGGAVPSDAHALRLFRNPGNGNAWLGVKLVGVKTNRAGMGARIEVTVEDRDRRRRTIYHTVGTGGSWGATSLRQHIGLGAAARIVDVSVWWPTSRTRQHFAKVAMNQYVEIREGAADYTRLDLKTCRLGHAAASASAAR